LKTIREKSETVVGEGSETVGGGGDFLTDTGAALGSMRTDRKGYGTKPVLSVISVVLSQSLPRPKMT
jgi:hypothetical protein